MPFSSNRTLVSVAIMSVCNSNERFSHTSEFLAQEIHSQQCHFPEIYSQFFSQNLIYQKQLLSRNIFIVVVSLQSNWLVQFEVFRSK